MNPWRFTRATIWEDHTFTSHLREADRVKNLQMVHAICWFGDRESKSSSQKNKVRDPLRELAAVARGPGKLKVAYRQPHLHFSMISAAANNN